MAVRHCDVKPSNLLVCGQIVKLADFSLAVPTTATMWYHRRCGTPRYCAPEVFQGWLSDRTDLYALAISYYQLRTGCFPFPDTPATIDAGYVRPEPDLSEVTHPEREVLRRAVGGAAGPLAELCRDDRATGALLQGAVESGMNPPLAG